MIANHYYAKAIVTTATFVVVELAAVSLDQSTINSLALLGVAIIGLYTANKTSKIPAIKEQVDAVHTLSNSAMGAQLKLNVQYAQAAALLAHRLAEISKEEGDAAAAKALDVNVIEQQELLKLHEIQQARVDAVQAEK